MKKIILAFIVFFAGLTLSVGSAFADPPGLQGKGGADFPRGLESHEKVPGGWEHGEKRGWDYDHHHRYHRHHNDHRGFDRD